VSDDATEEKDGPYDHACQDENLSGQMPGHKRHGGGAPKNIDVMTVQAEIKMVLNMARL